MSEQLTSRIKDVAEIPSGSYLVCMVKKFSWKEFFWVLVSFLLTLGGGQGFYARWILIFNSDGILHVCDMKFDSVPRDWIGHYSNDLSSKTQAELEEIYFNVDQKLLTKKYKHLLGLKWRDSRLISRS